MRDQHDMQCRPTAKDVDKSTCLTITNNESQAVLRALTILSCRSCPRDVHTRRGADAPSCNGDSHAINAASAPKSPQNMSPPGQEQVSTSDPSAVIAIPISPPDSVLRQSLRDSPLPCQSSRTTCHQYVDTNVLSNGRRIFVMNATEFDDLRRKVQMQTASRRYRKRKKVM